MKRPTFLTHFSLCLALAAGGFFAWLRGVPQTIFANDASMMTSVIAAILVVSAAVLGWQAWDTDAPPTYLGLDARGRRIDGRPEASSDFGHLAERLAVILGFVGTAIGLSMQATALATGGGAAFGPLATSLYTTASGGVAAGAIAIMTFSLERGIKRAVRP